MTSWATIGAYRPAGDEHAAARCILGAMLAERLAAGNGIGFYISVVIVEKRRIRWHDSAQPVDAA